jgi:NitT/TauT family transport system ATP-binding protein
MDQGDFVVILGRSGTGKSTFLNILLGYLKPTTGYCNFYGTAISEPSPTRIPIFQEDGLWPWLTVRNNLKTASRLSGNENSGQIDLNSLVSRVGLDKDILDCYPKELSVGMRKRVEIARALCAEPKMIIADEPFASIDIPTSLDMQEMFLAVSRDRNVAFLVATHDIDTAINIGTRILVLDGNRPSEICADLKNPILSDDRKRAHDRSSKKWQDFYSELCKKI